MKPLQNSQQVRQGPPEPVYGPSGDHIDLFGVDGLQQRFQSWTLVPALGTTDASVLIDFPDFPLGPIAHRAQLAQLIFGVLLGRADSQIDADALFHGGLPF
jgi:hypothetical protein